MRRRTLIITAAVTLGLGASIWKACDALGKGLCGNTLLNEARSPDGRYRLVTFERNCGATTDFSTQLSLLEAGEALANEAGNVFIADTDRGIAPSGPGGGPEVRVTWTSARTALIERHWKSRMFKAEARVGEVQFSFEASLHSAPADAGTLDGKSGEGRDPGVPRVDE